MSTLLEQADARSTVFDDCMLCVCFCQTAAALLGIGQCKQFYKDFLGLLKRANYAKQNKHIVKFSSHRHKYHRTSWLCRMKGFVCGAGNVISQSSSIPGPLHSRTCTDPGKDKDKMSILYHENLVPFTAVMPDEGCNGKSQTDKNLNLNISVLKKKYTHSCGCCHRSEESYCCKDS